MDYVQIEKLTEKVKSENIIIQKIREEIKKVIIGQEKLIDRVIICFFCDGHVLLEGLPGLAKTLAVKAFSRTVKSNFQRIQFTPDLLPADLIGTQIYNPKEMNFFTKKEPIFSNIILADEINRAPAKVQSALLQAMEERTVTIGDSTFKLEEPFMVLATENPIEQEGTYPLPEAQLDRFFMKVLIDYPSVEDEIKILSNYNELDADKVGGVISPGELSSLKKLIASIYVDNKLVEYIVALINETRKPTNKDIAKYLDFGASPRASIALMKSSQCVAFMRGRGFVTPDDIKEIASEVLRHRIILSYEAEADEMRPDDVVKMVLDSVEVP